jgi:hypothetical protein
MSAKSQQNQRQPTTPPRRRSSNGDVNRAPPRYSSLEAAFVENLSTAQTEDVPPTELAPPRYSSVFSLVRNHSRRMLAHPASDNRAAILDGNSKVASSSSGPQVHEYYIKSGGKFWATLKVMSRTSVGSSSPASSSLSSIQRVPRFTGSDLVQGSLELNLETPQNINSINLSVRSLSFPR